MKEKIKIIVLIFLIGINLFLFSQVSENEIKENYNIAEVNIAVNKIIDNIIENNTQIKNDKKLEQEKLLEDLERKRKIYTIKQQAIQKQKEYEEEQEKLRQEQELKENAKLIFIGDSRTVGMCNAVTGSAFWGTEYLDYTDSNGNVWIAHGGIAYAYLRDTGFPLAEAHLEPYDSIVVLMGINDDTPGSSYAELTNQFYERNKDLNISVYYVSINPVVDSSSAARQYNRTNALLSSKNQDIQKNLIEEVKYIDTYSEIINTFDTYDGIHYTDSVSKQIYNIIINSI